MAGSGGFLALQAKKKKESRKQEELERTFYQANENKSGKLSLEEWTALLQRTGHDVHR